MHTVSLLNKQIPVYHSTFGEYCYNTFYTGRVETKAL